MPSPTSEGEQRRFRCFGWRTKLLIFHGGFSACSGRPALKCRADNSSQQPPGAVGSPLHGDAGSGRRCTTARGAGGCVLLHREARPGSAALVVPGHSPCACVWGQGGCCGTSSKVGVSQGQTWMWQGLQGARWRLLNSQRCVDFPECPKLSSCSVSY